METCQVFCHTKGVGINVEYLNPSFPVKKPCRKFLLITTFTDIGHYSKLQPSLMPNIPFTLHTIAPWKHVINLNQTHAFYQIPLSIASLKYLVFVALKCTRDHAAMRMPGSDTALEELMCHVPGNIIQEELMMHCKLADDFYCGANTPQELISNWSCIFKVLSHCNLQLSAPKTMVCTISSTILG